MGSLKFLLCKNFFYAGNVICSLRAGKGELSMRRIKRVFFWILFLGFTVAGCGAVGPSDNGEEFYLIVPISPGISYEISGDFYTPSPGSPTDSGLHEGIDYDVPEGTPIIASAPGVVIEAGELGATGKRVLIQHTNNFRTNYGHLGSIQVANNQEVSRGQTIGFSGNIPGFQGNPHIHFGLYRDSQAIDPQPYFR